MAVFVGATSVIIRNSTIEARFPGGMESFAASRPNQTFCTDGTITRVGFMDDADAWTYIKQLVAAGLVPSDAEAHMEIALVHQEQGFAYSCDWLQLGLFDGYRSAWLAGTDRGNLFITEIELNSKLEWSSTEDFHRDNELVRVRRDGVEVYRNKKTGEKRYIGRPFRPARKWWQIWKSPGQVLVDSSNHNEVFKAAWNLIKPYITHQLPDAAVRGAARQELKRARENVFGHHCFQSRQLVGALGSRNCKQVLARSPIGLHGFPECIQAREGAAGCRSGAVQHLHGLGQR